MVEVKAVIDAFVRIDKHRLVRMILFTLLLSLCAGAQTASADDVTTPDWRRIRTNSVPYYPARISVDTGGGVWVTASNGSEYEPGVWHLPSGETRFQYLTDSRANNWLEGDFNNVVIKPSLDEEINYAVQDNAGNVWYALNNRSVLVEKADGTWLTLTMEDTSDVSYGSDTTNVDSVHTIRLVDNQDGTQNVLLIAYRSIKYINSSLTVADSRRVYTNYNNDYIYDALVDSQGRYWVITGNGAELGTSLTSTSYVKNMAEYSGDDEAPPLDSPLSGVEEDSEGNIWLSNSTNSSGVYCLKQDTDDWILHNLQTEAGSSNQVTSMAAGDNGTMWFGFNQTSGIVTYSGGVWSRTPLANLGLLTEIILDMSYHDGVLWFTTYKESSEPRDNAGVFALTTADSSVISYTYRLNSTSLTSNRIKSIAGDLSGGVWFAAYDQPSVARMKADGTWVQFKTDEMEFSYAPDQGSIPGIGVDSNNIVFMVPNRRSPIAYDIKAEQWLELPDGPAADTTFYGLYIDPKNGKWFLGAERVYYLDADNTAWTTYDTTDTSKFHDYRIEGALMDEDDNMWFIGSWVSGEITLMKKDPEGGDPTWVQFASGDASGYQGGSWVFQGKDGKVWNQYSQTFDSVTDTWTTQTDTTPYETRPMHFLNADIPADMDLTGAPLPLTETNQNLMTVDTMGNIYFAGGMVGLQSTNAGIVFLKAVDTDSDGLTDPQESGLGTDPNDSDSDDDGLSDGEEVNTYSTNPLKADTDGDGYSDKDEIDAETDPNDSDSDDDGLSDGEEVNTYSTNPLKADTDGDGYSDKDEIDAETDPNDINDAPIRSKSWKAIIPLILNQ